MYPTLHNTIIASRVCYTYTYRKTFHQQGKLDKVVWIAPIFDGNLNLPFDKISNKICFINSYVFLDKLFHASKHACNLSDIIFGRNNNSSVNHSEDDTFLQFARKTNGVVFLRANNKIAKHKRFSNDFLDVTFDDIKRYTYFATARFLTLDGRNLKNSIYLM